jgi:hypothetical protein
MISCILQLVEVDQYLAGHHAGDTLPGGFAVGTIFSDNYFFVLTFTLC